jgi:hypothetical protein
MKDVGVKGVYRIEVRNNKGQFDQAILEIKLPSVASLPPIGKQRQYPELISQLSTHRRQPCPKIEKIDWKLMTDLPVNSRTEAIQKIQWYALRWKSSTRS